MTPSDFQKVCSHGHNVKCEDCEKLKNVLEEVRGAISKHTMQLGKVQAEDHLYEGTMLPLRSLDGKGIS